MYVFALFPLPISVYYTTLDCHLQSCLLEAYFKLTVTFRLEVVLDSENVSTLFVDVTEVVSRSDIHHGAVVRDTAPNIGLNVFAVLDRILLHLFHVGLLAGAVAAADAFIVASLEQVTILERSEERLLLISNLLVGEGNIGSERREARIEAATLTHCVGPGLVSVDNFRVLLSVLITAHVLVALERFERVSNPIELGDRIGLHSRGETRSALRYGASRRTKRDVLEL